jgi:hypothetical protein
MVREMLRECQEMDDLDCNTHLKAGVKRMVNGGHLPSPEEAEISAAGKESRKIHFGKIHGAVAPCLIRGESMIKLNLLSWLKMKRDGNDAGIGQRRRRNAVMFGRT